MQISAGKSIKLKKIPWTKSNIKVIEPHVLLRISRQNITLDIGGHFEVSIALGLVFMAIFILVDSGFY